MGVHEFDEVVITGSIGPNLFPQRATMWHNECTVTVGNALLTQVITSQFYNTYGFQNPRAINDTFTHSFFLKAGTYTLSILGSTAGDRGIVSWDIDGSVEISGQDWYTAAPTYNVIKTGSVTVVGDGYHLLTCVVTGKHASASNYTAPFTKYWLKPASDPARV